MPTVTLTPQLERIILNSQTHHHIDESGEASLAQIQRAPASSWLHNPLGTINFGQSSYPYWFRTRITGLDQLPQTTYLRVDYAHLDELDIFLVRDGGIVEQYHTGDTTPFSSRPIPYRTYLVPLSAQQGSSVEIYVRIATEGPIQAPMDILTRAELDRQDKLNFLWFGAYFGIMIIMLFYNSLIFVFVRDLSYFLYLLYISATAFLQFT
ncbi:MAG TPA: 7TM-DISM domain-containing protein, partial [Candidatus Kapabacteria bacterium]|nr:7TM-DISM domain-containing protein [Candidatus Kapabacteria bacterium]